MGDDYDVEVAELKGIARGDPEVFKRWFARCEIRLRQSLRSFAESVDVETLVRETAFRVWERASTITSDGRPEFLLRWAVTVARNAARNQAKRSWREEPLDRYAEAAGPVGVVPDLMLRARIRHCREHLPATPRRVLNEHLADGGQCSGHDLAISLGMTFDAVRQNLTRARRALEQCLLKFGINVREYLK